MKVLFFCILSYPLLGVAEIAKAKKPDGSFFSQTFLEIELTSKPRLQYLCLKKLDPLSLGFSYLQQKDNEVSNIGSSKDFNGTRKLFISSVTYLALEQHLLKLSENMVQNELNHLSFLVDKGEAIADFLVNFHDEQENILFKSKSETDPELASLKSTNQHLKKEKKSKFDYSIIILVGTTGLVVCYAIYKSPSVIFRSSIHRQRAQRKRWLKNLVDSGRIEQRDYRFLLSQVDDLPNLIKARGLAHLDLPSEGTDWELAVALKILERNTPKPNEKET